MSLLLSLPLSIPCSETPIISTFDLSIYMGICLGIVASRREGEEAERKEGKEGNEKQLLIPVLKPNWIWESFSLSYQNMEVYIMIMRIILNKDRIDASSTNHPSRCESILLRYIMSIHPHRESISLPWPPLKMRIILIFSFFRGGGGLAAGSGENSP